MNEDFFEIIVALFFFVVWPLIRWFADQKKKRQEEAALAQAFEHEPQQPSDDEDEAYEEDDVVAEEPVYAAPIAETRAEWKDVVTADIDKLISRASTLADTARHERPLHRFVRPLEDFVVGNARDLRRSVHNTSASEDGIRYDVDALRMVLKQIRRFIRQRQNPKLVNKVGDADALAMACYTPLVEFAHARGLALTSTVPVTDYGDHDLATWAGFIPTGLAPLWLPKDFFRRIAWWPAIAHEIGHDFLAATPGLGAGLRAELGLPDEATGRWPVRFDRALTEEELYRVCGGWFEELFCDVFGTLMVGPAYAWAMVELFPTPSNPMMIAAVARDPAGLVYDVHPPRHLRLLVTTFILEKLGLSKTADEVREEWATLHGGMPSAILFPVGHQYVSVPIEAMSGLVLHIAEQLYERPFDVLRGHSFKDIPGIDFGPHAIAETKRVAAELLSDRVPHATDARWVIAGATTAWHEAPDRQKRIIKLVRRALRAVGTFEHADDAYEHMAIAAGREDIDDMREAFLLHEILSPPVVLRQKQPGFMALRFRA